MKKLAGLLGAKDLSIIQVSDFEMIDAGQRFNYTGDCVRAPPPTYDPLPDIKANGSDGPVNINSTDILSITISLAAGSSLNAGADWWLVASTPLAAPNNWDSYNVSGTWYPGFVVSYQGAIVNLSSIQVLNTQGLPPGTYTIYFGVDMIMNGSLDTGAGQLYYDSVVVNAQ